jgi:hypothetical protein
VRYTYRRKRTESPATSRLLLTNTLQPVVSRWRRGCPAHRSHTNMLWGVVFLLLFFSISFSTTITILVANKKAIKIITYHPPKSDCPWKPLTTAADVNKYTNSLNIYNSWAYLDRCVGTSTLHHVHLWPPTLDKVGSLCSPEPGAGTFSKSQEWTSKVSHTNEMIEEHSAAAHPHAKLKCSPVPEDTLQLLSLGQRTLHAC